MTLILGLEHRGRVHLLGDSISVAADDSASVVHDPKVFIRGDWAIGAAGSWRLLSLLRFKFRPPRLPAGTEPAKAVHVDFVDELQRMIRGEGFEPVKDSELPDDPTWELLIGFRGQLFTIDSELSITRNRDGVAAAGSTVACAAASCALLGLRPFKRGPELNMRKAAQLAAERCTAVSGPFLHVTV